MNCPNCGAKLENTDSITLDYDNGKYFDRLCGECLNCGKRYTWTEVFKFSHIINIEEDKEDE